MSKRDERLHWGHSTVDTACPLDCADSCSLAVTVEQGRVARIDGSDRNPTTAAFICAKVRDFAGRVYGAERLLHPAIRKGPKGSGRFERVSWEEALDLVARKLDEVRRTSGGESILPLYYGGSNGLVTQGTADFELFRGLGASRLARTLCAAATGAAHEALYGRMPGVAYEDYPHANLILLWGANPTVTSIHLVPFLKAARRRGARLVVVDPRQTPLARQADLHLAVRPGSDVAVALAIHRHLFEGGGADAAFLAEHTTGADRLRERAAAWSFERAGAVAGVPAAEIARLAAWYADASPALIRCGWGLERNRNGGSAVMSVLALPAVAGKFGVRGGGFTMSNSSIWGVSPATWLETPEPATRLVNMNQVGRLLTEPDGVPVHALFVYNANPLATLPDQNRVQRGLMREDLFTVVFEQVMTDTALYADVLLPATTFLETYDIARGYGSYSLQLVKPVIDAPGGVRPNVEVFAELGRRLGIQAAARYEFEAEALLSVAAHVPGGAGQELLEKGIAFPAEGRTPVQFVDVFPRTAGRRVRLWPEDVPSAAGLYGWQPDPATDDYPLALVSPASEKSISSTLSELRGRHASLYMHVADAQERGIEEGDTVRVFNALGQVECTVVVGDAIARGTVSLPKGLWRRHTLNGSSANALVPDALTDIGGGACFNDARVQVTRVLGAVLDQRNVSIWVADTGRGAAH
jgi:anaerobic selenocysteine-containing dehydrogenase